jgi:hypothetical protein
MDYVAFLTQHSISFKGPNKRGYVVLDCPFCKKEGKMNLLVEDDPKKSELKAGFSKCYSCHTADTPRLLSEMTGVNLNETRKMVYGKSNLEEVFYVKFNQIPEGIQTKKETLNEILEKYPTQSLPEFSVPIDLNTHIEARDYLLKRGLTEADIKTADVHVLGKSKDEIFRELKARNLPQEEMKLKLSQILRHLGRVIFPVKVNNRIYGFVSRDYTGKAEVKVLNSEGALTSSFFWNFDQAKKSRRLVICEGIFDAIKCGIHQSIALLGKATTDNSDRVKLIKKLNPEEVVIYLDNGAYSDAQALARTLSDTFPNVKIVVVRPYVSGVRVSDQLTKLVEKIVDVEVENDQYIIMPDDLWIVKEFAKVIEHSVASKKPAVAEAFQRIKIPKYESIKGSKKKMIDLAKRYDSLPNNFKASFLSQLSVFRKGGYTDAGDRTLEKNLELIENASNYLPFLDLNIFG